MLPTILAFLALLLICTWSLVYIIYRHPASLFKGPRPKTAIVLVLGDIGRSPRMMYHSESFAKLGWETIIVGYRGSTPLSSLMSLPHVHLKYLKDLPPSIRSLPFILAAPIKVLWQCASILWILLDARAEVLIVQNPPSIPTLLLARLASHIRQSRLIIDWHNTGHSILALKLGSGSPIVRGAKWFEATFGRTAFAHLFVTHAMKDYLSREWNLVGEKIVLHDRPPAHFRRCGPMTTHELFGRLVAVLDPPLPRSILPASGLSTREQIFTSISEAAQGTVQYNPERPALIVSSTSWTPDEDFTVLLSALSLYETQAKEQTSLPRLVVIISGRGPLLPTFKKLYAERSEKEMWCKVVVRTVWLEITDYPRFLGCADLGISLHQSSSGLDLPMKVVDMFGCGVPVLARGFRCVGELVKHDQNGMVFNTADDLVDQLKTVLAGFPDAGKLKRLQSYFPDDHTPDLPGAHSHVTKISREFDGTQSEDEWATWEDQWKRVVAPIVERSLRSREG